MGVDNCYAMVRGSGVRVTGLGIRGSIPDPVPFAVSKSVAKVTINEMVESGSDEILSSTENDNDSRLRMRQSSQLVGYSVDIDFIRTDPGVLNLVAGVPLVSKNLAPGASLGYGGSPFGETPFGGGLGEEVLGFGAGSFGVEGFSIGGAGGGSGDYDTGSTEGTNEIRGFDANTRIPPVSFALEVWSKLAGQPCAVSDEGGFDTLGFGDGGFGGEGGIYRTYGYTLFPYLRGGHLTGFRFENGLVSFNLRGAKTRRMPKWGIGPYDLQGPFRRLQVPVSRNTFYRQAVLPVSPPEQADGVQQFEDVIEGGSATVTSDDVIGGGGAAYTSDWTIEGGGAL